MGNAARRAIARGFFGRRRFAAGCLSLRLSDQIAAPGGEVGPIWTNLAPNLAKTASAQCIELCADGQDARTQRHELVALTGFFAKLNCQAIRLVKRLAKLG
jgi:hypothetical protein